MMMMVVMMISTLTWNVAVKPCLACRQARARSRQDYPQTLLPLLRKGRPKTKREKKKKINKTRQGWRLSKLFLCSTWNTSHVWSVELLSKEFDMPCTPSRNTTQNYTHLLGVAMYFFVNALCMYLCLCAVGTLTQIYEPLTTSRSHSVKIGSDWITGGFRRNRVLHHHDFMISSITVPIPSKSERDMAH